MPEPTATAATIVASPLRASAAHASAPSPALVISPRAAYYAHDTTASREAHAERQKAAAAAEAYAASADHSAPPPVAVAAEDHGGLGADFVKSLVFGGLDGVITTFSTIASVAGGALGIQTVLVLGFANLIADGISMGAGDYLSSLAELNFLLSEQQRAQLIAERRSRGLIEALERKGLRSDDAAELVSICSKDAPAYRDVLRDLVLTEQLEQEVPDDLLGPAKDGAVTFVSFLIFGSVPLWVYVITYGAHYTNVGGTFGISAAACACSLFALGVVQGSITRQNRMRAGLYMTINGGLAGAAAYLVSWGVSQAIGNGGAGAGGC